MMDLGYTAAMVVVLEIRDKNKEKALNIALNKIDGKWDQAVLKDLLLELDLNGYDFSITGFHQDELEDLIQALDVPAEANDDDFDPDEARERIEAPVTNRGDIWQLGRHRLMCGDATDPEDVAALMRGELLDLARIRHTTWTMAPRSTASPAISRIKTGAISTISRRTAWTP